MKNALAAVLLAVLAVPALAGDVSRKPVRWSKASDTGRVHALKARLEGATVQETEQRQPVPMKRGAERLRVPVEAFQVVWLRPDTGNACRAADAPKPGPDALTTTAVEK